MNSWIKQTTGGDPDRIASGYKPTGSVAESGSSVAFIAPFAVAPATDTAGQAWLDGLDHCSRSRSGPPRSARGKRRPYP
ncbi:hypothetical protein ACIQI8_27780 [Streptomyces sp. NPDC092369]|uniref:hypothetical protein n=1 Tax=Streptomyces sp. NPDC092369 TaxID=3366015 RepID=UPI0038167961